MVPKKTKEFRKITAANTGYSEDLVNALIDFYWHKLRIALSNLVYQKILISKLGTFNIRDWKLDETIENYENTIRSIEGKFNKHPMLLDITTKIENIKRLKKLINKETVKLTLKKEKRKHDESIKNLEK